MPHAKLKNADGLDIVLDQSTPQVIFPGQILSGHAVLSSTEESVSIGSVTATLYGRSKVKIFQSYGQSSAVYKSRANFFNIEQQIFKSDYTYGAGSYSWPFSFEMPFVADETCLKAKKSDRFKPHEYWLSTDDVDVIDQEMPPPVFHYHGMWGRAVWAFVEYVLEVTVSEAPGSHRILGPQSKTSTRPINFQPGRREDILRDHALQSKQGQLAIQSSRLVPEVATQTPPQAPRSSPDLLPVISNEPITKVESRGSSKMRAAFSRMGITSSSTPRLGLNYTLTYPTVLQVHHPDSLPFRLSITLDDGPQTANVDLSNLPSIRIKSLDLSLICQTRCRALPGLWQEKDHKSISIHLAKDAQLDHLIKLAHPKELSEKSDDASRLSTTQATVNFGDLVPLRLTSAKIGRYYEPILNPSFQTYNLCRRYGMKWTIELEIAASQKVFREKIKGEVPTGDITVRGIPDSLRTQAFPTSGAYDSVVTDGLPQEVQGDQDDDDDNSGPGSDSPEREGARKRDKKGHKALFRRSHDGSSRKAKEEQAREEQQQHPPHGEQLPKYEA